MALARAIDRCTVKAHCSVLVKGFPSSSTGWKAEDFERARVRLLTVLKALAMMML